MRSYKGNTCSQQPSDHEEGKRKGSLVFLLNYNSMHHMMVLTFCDFRGILLSWYHYWESLRTVCKNLRLSPKLCRVAKVCSMIRNHKTRLKISNKNDIEDFTSSCFMAKGEPSCFNFLTISSILFAEKRLEEKKSVNKLLQSLFYLWRDVRNGA